MDTGTRVDRSFSGLQRFNLNVKPGAVLFERLVRVSRENLNYAQEGLDQEGTGPAL